MAFGSFLGLAASAAHAQAAPAPLPPAIAKPRGGRFWTFVLGFILGAAALFGLALFASLRSL